MSQSKCAECGAKSWSIKGSVLCCSCDNGISMLVGLTIDKIDSSEDVILFLSGDKVFKMYHEQDCCECVAVEDVCGDLGDLIGTPILVAEERSNDGSNEYGTETWTFYEFRTVKGSVTIRWRGESNGYYSEAVDFIRIK